MVNKEFIVGSGGIIKDFTDRNIPQNSNNFVSVGVLIPVSEFDELNNYSVLLATSKIISGVETSLPSLITYSAKTLKIEGVDYIKFQCQLSISYTNFIGQLKLTPYIVETTIENEGEEDEEVVITTQKTFTNTTLNVIRSIASTSDASLEEAEAVETLTALIEAKNIKLIEDYKNGTKAQAIIGCFTDYNASYYEGWLLIVKYSGGEIALLPYKNSANNEFTEIDLDGSMYKLSDYSSGTYTSTLLTASKDYVDTNFYKKTETYSDDEVDSLLNAKVDKTTKVNGHALSGDVDVSKSDVGLGNVENYGIVLSPSADATNKYQDAGGLYTYLQAKYYTRSDLNDTITKVNELYALYKDATPDNDNVVNTLYDLVQVFSNFPESENIADIFSGIDSRLDLLESEGNVVINCGSATIETTDWEANSDSYSTDYPYKATITKSELKGATNFDVIFSVDADTSLLSTTAILDNTTGTITFYASDEPSESISIDNIVAFTNLNAINTLTTDTIHQVELNKNNISDLALNKADKSKAITTYTGKIGFDAYESNKVLENYMEVKKDSTHYAYIVGKADERAGQTPIKAFIDVKNGSDESKVNVEGGKVELISGTHTFRLNKNGNLTLDGNAIGGGHANFKTFNVAITTDANEPNTYHLDTSIPYIITDLETGSTPTSYNTGDVVYGVSQDSNGNDRLEAIYIITNYENNDLTLQSKMDAKPYLLTTSTDATYSNNEYTLAFSNFSDMPSVKDYVAFIDSGAISTLYQVESLDWDYEYAVLTKIGSIGGGGTGTHLYLHAIQIENNQNNPTTTIRTFIINDINTQFTMATLNSYLSAKGFTARDNALISSGYSSSQRINGIYYSSTEGSVNYTYDAYNYSSFSVGDFTDTIIDLGTTQMVVEPLTGLYQHNIKFYNSTKYVRASLSIINDSSVAFDKASLQQYIIDNYEDYNHPFTDIRGTFSDGGTNYIINYCHKATSSTIDIFGSISTSMQDISFDLTANSVSSFVDYVKAL